MKVINSTPAALAPAAAAAAAAATASAAAPHAHVYAASSISENIRERETFRFVCLSRAVLQIGCSTFTHFVRLFCTSSDLAARLRIPRPPSRLTDHWL